MMKKILLMLCLAAVVLAGCSARTASPTQSSKKGNCTRS